MKHFISCDWGTTSFRLRLIDATTKQILAETKSVQGIATIYGLWKEQPSVDRILFYSNVILQQIRILKKKVGYSLDNLPVIISGMASSSIGMLELPYKQIPFNVNTAELNIHIIPATETCRHQMIIISGVCTANDVMRGEETILAGCSIENTNDEQLFIFPGTHSKHVVIQNGVVKEIKTYMTGELFDLLSSKSILSASVEVDIMISNSESFIKGIREAATTNFLNSIFHVRTNQLLGASDKKENYHYLSGLLIGEELKDIQNKNYVSVTVVSSGTLLTLYTEALSVLGLKDKSKQQEADEALIKGQALILNLYQ
ncbi:MAG TPA: 2-dehydro-3-deoxygalactonokinase [Panacibacter sp.]|nr:2-dehydro-3-deoxygalactonokinase [Panacibacter sp.]